MSGDLALRYKGKPDTRLSIKFTWEFKFNRMRKKSLNLKLWSQIYKDSSIKYGKL